jgi:hypothetical protein
MTILNQPCPECFREEDGKWFYPCPSDDCVLHAPFTREEMLVYLEAARLTLDEAVNGTQPNLIAESLDLSDDYLRALLGRLERFMQS